MRFIPRAPILFAQILKKHIFVLCRNKKAAELLKFNGLFKMVEVK